MSDQGSTGKPGSAAQRIRLLRAFLSLLVLVVGMALWLLTLAPGLPRPVGAAGNLDPAALPQVLVTSADLDGAFTLTLRTLNSTATVVGFSNPVPDAVLSGAYLSQVDGNFASTDRAPRGITGLQIAVLAFRGPGEASLFFNRLADSTPNQVVGAAAPLIGDVRAIVVNGISANQVDARVIVLRSNTVFGARVVGVPPASAVDVAIEAARAQLAKIDAVLFGTIPSAATAATSTSPTPTPSASPSPSPVPLATAVAGTPSPVATPLLSPRPTPPVATPTPTSVIGSDEDPPQSSL